MKKRFANKHFTAFAIEIDTKTHVNKLCGYIDTCTPLKVNDGSECDMCNEPTKGVQCAKPGDILIVYAVEGSPWNVDWCTRQYFDHETAWSDHIPLFTFDDGEHIISGIKQVVEKAHKLKHNTDKGLLSFNCEVIGDYVIINERLCIHRKELPNNGKDIHENINNFIEVALKATDAKAKDFMPALNEAIKTILKLVD